MFHAKFSRATRLTISEIFVEKILKSVVEILRHVERLDQCLRCIKVYALCETAFTIYGVKRDSESARQLADFQIVKTKQVR